MNVVRAQNDLKRLFSIMLVLQMVTLVLSLGIILILLSSTKKTPFSRSVELLSPTNPSGTASPVLNKSKNKLSFERLLYKEKTLANILEIPTEVGMFVIAFSGVPRPKPVFGLFSGVSVLTKGTIVSKFLGYLYSERGAEVIESDYPLPQGCVLSCLHFFKGRQSIQGRTRAPYSILSQEEERRRNPVPPRMAVLPLRCEVQLWTTQCVEVRHVLMMTAPTQCILVSLKQADEALRKGRNTLNRESNERC